MKFIAELASTELCGNPTRDGTPCIRYPRHRGACSGYTPGTRPPLEPEPDRLIFARHLRERAQKMTPEQLLGIARFHELAAKVLREELASR